MSLPIGFTARRNTAPVVSAVPPCSKTLFVLDSGRHLSMENAIRSTSAIGGTGSGKTTSVVLPMADSLIAGGFGGLILDVKGNLRPKILAIAAHHGRLDDVVEFGTSPTACRTDFLAGMGEHEVVELFSSLATCGIGEGNQNMNFFLHGGCIYRDVWRCLRDISRVCPGSEFSEQFIPTLAKVYRVVNNAPLAQGLWAFYLASIRHAIKEYERNGEEPPDSVVKAEEFAGLVRSDNHHVLREPGVEATAQYRDQLSYALDHINGQFSTLDMTYGLLDRFSCVDEDSVPMDFDQLVYHDRKIVLVHFAMDSGRAGEILSKTIKARYYQSVFRNGLQSDGYTFMIGDEFQSIIDTSPDARLNDMDFFSMSREYRNINVIATQSVASLRAKGGAEAVTSLLANCMTKIVLQTPDPETDAWLRSMVGGRGPYLKDLGRGECVIMLPDGEGRLIDAEDSVNNAYGSLREILGSYREPLRIEQPRPVPQWRVGAAGFPYAIAKVLTAPCDPMCKNKEGEMTRHGDAIYKSLCLMREASMGGKPFWDQSAPRHEYDTSFELRSIL